MKKRVLIIVTVLLMMLNVGNTQAAANKKVYYWGNSELKELTRVGSDYTIKSIKYGKLKSNMLGIKKNTYVYVYKYTVRTLENENVTGYALLYPSKKRKYNWCNYYKCGKNYYSVFVLGTTELKLKNWKYVNL